MKTLSGSRPRWPQAHAWVGFWLGDPPHHWGRGPLRTMMGLLGFFVRAVSWPLVQIDSDVASPVRTAMGLFVFAGSP